MSSRPVNYLLFATVVFQISLLTSVCAAQNRPPISKTAAAMPTPRSPDGHPDLSGFWVASIAGIPTYHEANPSEKLLTRSADGSTFFDYGGSNAQGNGTAAGKPQQPAELIS